MDKIFDVYLAPRDQPDSESYVELALPATPYQMLDALEKLRVKEDGAVYWEITGYRQFEGLSSVLNHTCGLFDLNALANRLSELDTLQRTSFLGFVNIEQRRNSPVRISRLIDLSYSTDCCHVVTEVQNDAQLGRFCVENGFLPELEDLPDKVRNLLDYGRIGRSHRQIEGGVYVERGADYPGGYVEQHREPWQVYNSFFRTAKKPSYTVLAETFDGSRVEFPFPANEPMGTEIVRCVDCAAPSLIGMSGGMETVDLLARRLVGMEPEALSTYKALLETADCHDLHAASLLTNTLSRYTLSPRNRSPAEVAKEALSVILSEREAGALIPYLNLHEYGQALIQNSGGVMTPYGLIQRADGQPMQEVEMEPAQGGMTMQ